MENTAMRCPACGEPGSPVKPVTLDAMVSPSARSNLTDDPARFCGSRTCETVYFSETRTRQIEKSDVAVRVGSKETESPRPLCYCFDHTAEEVFDEVERTGKSTVLQDIRTRLKSGCWCETRNPKGVCCLQDVAAVEREALEKFGKRSAPPPPPSGSLWERLTKIGAIFAAVAASACCWLPLLLIAFGVSGVAVSSVFERYRPILLGVTAGFLGLAFYLTYRPRRVSATPEGEACSTGEGGCCPPEGAAAIGGVRRFNKVMLWVVTAVVAAFAFFPSYVGAFLASGSEPNELQAISPDSERLVLKIDGMTCEACATHLDTNLGGLPGVESASVSYDTGSATVYARPTVTEEQLRKTISETGYQLVEVQRGKNP